MLTDLKQLAVNKQTASTKRHCATKFSISKRQWIGIDISEKAYDLVKERLNNPVKTTDFENGKAWNFEGKTVQRTDIPLRTNQAPALKISYADMRRKLYQLQNGQCNLCQYSFDEHNLKS